MRSTGQTGGERGAVLAALEAERDRWMKAFATAGDPRPYFLAYQVTDRTDTTVSASYGALVDDEHSRARTLNVDVRVGSHELDNTRPIRGSPIANFTRMVGDAWSIPLDDEAAKLRPTIWIATDKTYKRAKEAYMRVKGNAAITTKASDNSPDFSREKPIRHIEVFKTLNVDRRVWAAKVRAFSKRFAGHRHILRASVSLRASVVNRALATSEGTAVQVGRVYVRLGILAEARTDDGMDLMRYESFDVHDGDRLPTDAAVTAKIDEVISDLEHLRAAPVAEPYVGPAIIDGEAAGVYFHEIFGHRVEGHRQKDDEEGQTFAKKVGKPVMPSFIDVYDDPTIVSLNGVDLNGHYTVDDEGVRAQKASLVERGVLKGFLLSRTPTRGFLRSNGHGRRQEGLPVVARQGNLIVHPTQTVSRAKLKNRLLEEVKRQNKAYGLRFHLTTGGFTGTTRYSIQAFRVRPVMVYKVYPDGREELVRGANIEGTPLTSLSQIIAASDDLSVFNGYCGAESGMVPVAAASPSLLVSRVEISRQSTSQKKPPILPPPGPGTGGAK